jgi:hypothetical protein
VTTSEYLKTQADLLIVMGILRRLKLGEFIASAEIAQAQGGCMTDCQGLPVHTDAARMERIARAAQTLLTSSTEEPMTDLITPAGATAMVVHHA